MKALHFANPIEYRVESAVDALNQGDGFSGIFYAVNRWARPLEGLCFSVALSYAEFRAIKKDAPAALAAGLLGAEEPTVLGEGINLAPGENFRSDWSYQLPLDCPITSKTGAVFLIYGGGSPTEPVYGRLDLPVGMTPLLDAFLGTLESQFAFAESTRKHNKGFAEVILKPPGNYPRLKRLTLRMRHQGEGVDFVWLARVKGLSRGAGGVQTKTLTYEQTLPTEQLLMSGEYPNRAFFKQSIQASLAELVPNF